MYFTIDASTDGFNSQYRLQRNREWGPLDAPDTVQVSVLQHANRIASQRTIVQVNGRRYSQAPGNGLPVMCIYAQAHFKLTPRVTIDDLHTAFILGVKLNGPDFLWPVVKIDGTTHLATDLADVRMSSLIATYDTAISLHDALRMGQAGTMSDDLAEVHEALDKGWQHHLRTNDRNYFARCD